MVRNAALHAGTPSASVNEGIERFTRNILAVFRQNANDPATTFNGSTRKRRNRGGYRKRFERT
ncbi:MAG TPA: hypothetical protein VEN79_16155, partial [Terriglobia bacterium]|nr:hypothetical protein [Terriglobia bacterium]